jgi:hypothetical protein
LRSPSACLGLPRRYHLAARLLRSRKLKLARATAARRPGPLPDPLVPGDWDITDSDCVLEIGIRDGEVIVACWNVEDGEELVVTETRWDREVLEFRTLCRSTGWRLRNRLARFEPSSLMLFRSGSSREPALVRRLHVDE